MKVFEHGGNIYDSQQVHDFSANINPLGLSDLGKEACQDWAIAVQHYPQPEAKDLCAKIATFYDVPVDQVVLGNGATELLYLLAHTLQPQRLVVPAPTFSEYERAVYRLGIPVVRETYESIIWGDFTWQDGDWLCLGSPNNPDGKSLQEADFQQLMQSTTACRMHVLIDESFVDFNAQLPSFRREVAKFSHLLVLHSFTKFWAVPGLRIGALYAPRSIVEELRWRKDVWNVNVMAARYLEGALQDKDYYERSQSLLNQERHRVYEMYRSLPGCEARWPVVNYMLLHFSPTRAQQIMKNLRKQGILVRDCSNYYNLGDGYIRIAIRTPEENDFLYSHFLKEVKKSD